MNGEKPSASSLFFAEPDNVGLHNVLIGTDSCQSIVVANNIVNIGPIKYPVFMCEILRKNAEGFRSRKVLFFTCICIKC